MNIKVFIRNAQTDVIPPNFYSVYGLLSHEYFDFHKVVNKCSSVYRDFKRFNIIIDEQ